MHSKIVEQNGRQDDYDVTGTSAAFYSLKLRLISLEGGLSKDTIFDGGARQRISVHNPRHT